VHPHLTRERKENGRSSRLTLKHKHKRGKGERNELIRVRNQRLPGKIWWMAKKTRPRQVQTQTQMGTRRQQRLCMGRKAGGKRVNQFNEARCLGRSTGQNKGRLRPCNNKEKRTKKVSRKQSVGGKAQRETTGAHFRARLLMGKCQNTHQKGIFLRPEGKDDLIKFSGRAQPKANRRDTRNTRTGTPVVSQIEAAAGDNQRQYVLQTDLYARNEETHRGKRGKSY